MRLLDIPHDFSDGASSRSAGPDADIAPAEVGGRVSATPAQLWNPRHVEIYDPPLTRELNPRLAKPSE